MGGHALLAALVTPVFGFSGLCLVHLFKHGNRLEEALKDRDALLTAKLAELTDALVRIATLEADLKAANALLAAYVKADTPDGGDCGGCELKFLKEKTDVDPTNQTPEA